MTKHDFKQNAYYVIYLIRCVLHNKVPSKEKLDKMDLEQLFEVAKAHSLAAMTAYALESAGIFDPAFEEAKNKAIRKNILFDAERARIFAELEKAGIWYMPLKGAILKDMYPDIGMRQMSDNDILYDSKKREEIKKIMLSFDFELTSELDAVEAYTKEPIYNFEMHSSLFMSYQVGDIAEYYQGIKRKLKKDLNNNFGFHFSYEDFYIFMIAHEFKHYYIGGTGIRSLVDTYIFLKSHNNSLDWNYISTETKKLRIGDFEKNNRELALSVFNNEVPTDKEILDYYIFSGTYGTSENEINNQIIKSGSKWKYILYRIFPPIEYYKRSVPWAFKNKWLLPIAWIYRLIRGISTNKTGIKSEYRQLSCKNSSTYNKNN